MNGGTIETQLGSEKSGPAPTLGDESMVRSPFGVSAYVRGPI